MSSELVEKLTWLVEHYDGESDYIGVRPEMLAEVCDALSDKDKLEEALREARGALETCAKTFRRYGELHRAKGTSEGNLKASNNDDLAEFCESVLADTALLQHKERGE